jgi:hypothetical protein
MIMCTHLPLTTRPRRPDLPMTVRRAFTLTGSRPRPVEYFRV